MPPIHTYVYCNLAARGWIEVYEHILLIASMASTDWATGMAQLI